MYDPMMIRRKLQGVLQTLWPQLLLWLRSEGWEPWVDKVLAIMPMVGRLLGLNLSLPPHPWQQSLPEAAAEHLQALSDEQLVTLVATAKRYVDWLADAGGGAGGTDTGE